MYAILEAVKDHFKEKQDARNNMKKMIIVASFTISLYTTIRCYTCFSDTFIDSVMIVLILYEAVIVVLVQLLMHCTNVK